MNIKDFNTRDDLETAVVNTHGRTPDPKQDTITGTTEELQKFRLRHGQRVWGVPVIASDHEQQKAKNKLSRGEIKPSFINGLIKSKNANKSKSR